MDETNRSSPPPPAHAPEKVARAKAFCETLFRKLELPVTVESRETPEAIGVSLIPGSGAEGEINSALLEAVQYLANRVVNPSADGRKWVNLDVGGFREEGDPAVAAMAARLAASAVKMGKVLAVAPISPRERRQIHVALVGNETVSTHSEGEGIFRQLLIIPGSAGGARRS
ncbi:MAG TPA: R3H domain-containing nucleic acid-binding protein [Anaeromyxobacteraceae bacterium]|nr:R3H domain-containing nucleic acid-binding protein [Anaeromyxobacteraceae bacterium]